MMRLVQQGRNNAPVFHKMGNIWFVIGNDINQFNPKTKQFTVFPYKIDDHDWKEHVSDITTDTANNLWFHYKNNGLSVFNITNKTYFTFRHDKFDPDSLSINDITTIFIDSTGMVWITTWGGGINILDLYANPFLHYKHHPLYKDSLSGNQVTAIHEGPENIFWIGTWGLEFF